MKKPRKTKSPQAKFNAHKLRVLKRAKFSLNHFAICNTYSNEKANTVLFMAGKPTNLTEKIAFSLENVRTHWSVTVGVFCRNQQGKRYAIYTEIQAKKECSSEQLADVVKALEIQLMEYAPKMEKLCPFWLAPPRSNNKPNDLNLALKTAARFNVFGELITTFEKAVNKQTNPQRQPWYEIATDFEWKFVDVDLEEYYSNESEVNQ